MREVVWKGSRAYCPRCEGFLLGGEWFKGRACGTCHGETVLAIPHNEDALVIESKRIASLESALTTARDELAREREAIAAWCDKRASEQDEIALGGEMLRVGGTREYRARAGAFRECAEFVRNRSKP